MSASHCNVTHSYFRPSLRILLPLFLVSKTQLCILIWAILRYCIGSSGRPLHPHLVDYNEVNDKITCFISKNHLKKLDQEKSKEDTFLSTGFHNWQRALTSFQQHSKCHFAALTVAVTVPQCLDVIAIANLFVQSKGSRKRVFGKFIKKDLQSNNDKLFA